MAAVGVPDVKDLHVRMVNRQVIALLEADAVQPACKPEHCVDAAVQREIRLEHIIAYAIAGIAVLFRPIAEVPRLKPIVLESYSLTSNPFSFAKCRT